jgi:hypothetical protein
MVYIIAYIPVLAEPWSARPGGLLFNGKTGSEIFLLSISSQLVESPEPSAVKVVARAATMDSSCWASFARRGRAYPIWSRTVVTVLFPELALQVGHVLRVLKLIELLQHSGCDLLSEPCCIRICGDASVLGHSHQACQPAPCRQRRAWNFLDRIEGIRQGQGGGGSGIAANSDPQEPQCTPATSSQNTYLKYLFGPSNENKGSLG